MTVGDQLNATPIKMQVEFNVPASEHIRKGISKCTSDSTTSLCSLFISNPLISTIFSHAIFAPFLAVCFLTSLVFLPSLVWVHSGAFQLPEMGSALPLELHNC